MAISKYKRGKATVLSAYFKSTEFDCEGKDCCTETLIDSDLLNVLTKVRQRFGPVIINSGYRCRKHNADIGGASASKHISGQAADIRVKDAKGNTVDPLRVGVFIDSLFANTYGIEVGSYDTSTGGYVHVDTRGSKWRAIKPAASNGGKYTTYSTLTPTLRVESKGDAVLVLSRKLKGLKYFKKAATSTFNADLQSAVINFQRDNGLTADGIVGPRTWAKIVGLI